ncbi:MAG: hypothetical protein O2956_12705 [Gemmatimonadetes bacterium]|nr:hypothetical protein [Gemmatimonadota bacterium]
MRAIRRLAAAALVVLWPGALAAQTSGVLPKVTQLPSSTRAMALGDAYMMDAGHADALFNHPALLTNAAGFGLDVQRWGPHSSSTAVSAAMQWLGGGLAVGLRTLQHSPFGTGAQAAPPDQDHLFDFGSTSVSERVATLGYARSALFDIDVGVGLNLIDERVGNARQSVVLFDVGLSREVGPVVVGVTAHDLGEKPVFDTGKKPTRVVIGAGNYGQQLGIFDIGYTATIGFDEDDVSYGAGIEVGYWPIQGRTFVARVGFQDVPTGSDASPLTTGFAFWGDNVTLEWAFRPFSDAAEGGSHRFGVRWR